MTSTGMSLIRRDERRFGCPLAFTMGKANWRHHRLARWSAAVHGGRGLRLLAVAEATLGAEAFATWMSCSQCGDTETVELSTERHTIAVCATCGSAE